MPPPKGQRANAGHGRSARVNEEVEETFPAIIFSDTFERRFGPFTLGKPRCLLPLGNVPVIEYTLGFLAHAGVQEIFIYAGAHADQVEEYLNRSRWRRPGSPFRKVVFLRSEASSIGDVMRDLHQKHIIENDFLTVHGDVVSNYPIEQALREHRVRRIKDKEAIMTMVLKQSKNRDTQPSGTTPVYVLDNATGRCLQYDEIDCAPERNAPTIKDLRDKRAVERYDVEASFLDKFNDLMIRTDLIDTSIDICTPEVLGLWADSFDYQTPRRQFLHGVLKDYDLNGKTIHTHIIRDTSYAARVRTLRAYDNISQDIMKRYAYPFTPEANLSPGTSYRLRRCDAYLEEGVLRSKSADVSQRSIVGLGTEVGDGSRVHRSVVGRHCKIGKNVVIDRAYIWDNVVVGDGAVIRASALADGAKVGNGARVEGGTLLSFNVEIGKDKVVERGVRIVLPTSLSESSASSATTSSDDSEDTPVDEGLVGKDGKGVRFRPKEEDDYDSEEDDITAALSYFHLRDSQDEESISVSSVESEEEIEGETLSDYDSDMSEDSETPAGADLFSPGSEFTDWSAFHHDATVSLYDGLREGNSSDVIQLELVSLRMSANAPEAEVRLAVAEAFAKIFNFKIAESGQSAAVMVPQILQKYKGIFERVLSADDASDGDAKAAAADSKNTSEGKNNSAIHLLKAFEQQCVRAPRGAHVLLYVAKGFYDLDLIEEDAIFKWWSEKPRAEAQEVRTLTKAFIDWLENAESESGSEEEEEEEESDEE